MTGHERAGYRKRLVNLLRRLGGTVHELRDDRRDADGPVDTLTDAGDVGAHEYGEQVDLAVAGTEEGLLAEVEAALARLDAGTFGRCGACERSVEPERLAAVPYARLCADCARRAESARR
jgi:RNA polymerase-binding transcription factor DksA